MSKITPCLWFDGEAEEAARFYVSVLPGSRLDLPAAGEGAGADPAKAMAVPFTLAGQSYLALNGRQGAGFTPAVSFIIGCEDQAEIDRLWAALLDGGAPQRCGWLTDRYGVSWQIVPNALARMMTVARPEQARRVMGALMGMVKLDLAALEAAFADPAG